jgi:hypothetical protein
MSAIALHLADGTTAGIYYCGKCRHVARTQAEAEQCCKPRVCACGKKTEGYWTVCHDCREKAERAKEAKRFADAEKLTAWDGPVFAEGIGPQDGFFETVDDLTEHCEDNGMSLPPYVWPCDKVPFAVVDFDDIVEAAAYEDFDAGDLSGTAELKAAIEAFNEANKALCLWEPNYKKALVLTAEGEVRR